MIIYVLQQVFNYSTISIMVLSVLFVLIMGIDALVISTILGGLYLLTYI